MAAKKPLSQRGAPAPINLDDVFGNALGIPPEVAKEIESQGKVHRFINAKRLGDMGGYHPQGWVPYRASDTARGNMDGQALLFGNDPNGYIRRGDCILAVRPKELNEKHKAYLKRESVRTSNVAKTAAASVREYIRANGLDMRVQEGAEVHEGFDKDDDE